ncbi:hypothetical protein GE061_020294 [Apolygus lucorum]|nr:hypothetical protein GE061_020294 [Apolygus lucorum]
MAMTTEFQEFLTNNKNILYSARLSPYNEKRRPLSQSENETKLLIRAFEILTFFHYVKLCETYSVFPNSIRLDPETAKDGSYSFWTLPQLAQRFILASLQVTGKTVLVFKDNHPQTPPLQQQPLPQTPQVPNMFVDIHLSPEVLRNHRSHHQNEDTRNVLSDNNPIQHIPPPSQQPPPMEQNAPPLSVPPVSNNFVVSPSFEKRYSLEKSWSLSSLLTSDSEGAEDSEDAEIYRTEYEDVNFKVGNTVSIPLMPHRHDEEQEKEDVDVAASKYDNHGSVVDNVEDDDAATSWSSDCEMYDRKYYEELVANFMTDSLHDGGVSNTVKGGYSGDRMKDLLVGLTIVTSSSDGETASSESSNNYDFTSVLMKNVLGEADFREFRRLILRRHGHHRRNHTRAEEGALSESQRRERLVELLFKNREKLARYKRMSKNAQSIISSSIVLGGGGIKDGRQRRRLQKTTEDSIKHGGCCTVGNDGTIFKLIYSDLRFHLCDFILYNVVMYIPRADNNHDSSSPPTSSFGPIDRMNEDAESDYAILTNINYHPITAQSPSEEDDRHDNYTADESNLYLSFEYKYYYSKYSNRYCFKTDIIPTLPLHNRHELHHPVSGRPKEDFIELGLTSNYKTTSTNEQDNKGVCIILCTDYIVTFDVRKGLGTIQLQALQGDDVTEEQHEKIKNLIIVVSFTPGRKV